MSDVILFRVRPGVTWTQPYIYIYIYKDHKEHKEHMLTIIMRIISINYIEKLNITRDRHKTESLASKPHTQQTLILQATE